MLNNSMRTKKEIIDEIINYFEENADTFTKCIEELDDRTGCLGDERCRPMDKFDDEMSWYTQLEIAELASGGMFSADDAYFYMIGDELYSTDEPDYTDFLNEDTILSMLWHSPYYVDSIAEDVKLQALFDELEVAQSD